jgi:hypothetical protein
LGGQRAIGQPGTRIASAPVPIIHASGGKRSNSTLLGHSAFALGMALLPHLEGLFQASAWYDGSTSTAMVKEI